MDVSVLQAEGTSHVMYKRQLLAEVFTDPGDKFLQELKHCRSSVTPFVGDQFIRLVQQSVVAAVVNDGRVDGDLVLRED